MFTHRQRATVKAFLSEWTEEYVCVRVCVSAPNSSTSSFLVALLTHSNSKQNGSGCGDFST